MLSVEEWQAIGIVFGSISAVCAAVIGLAAVARMAVRGARRMFGLFRKMSTLVDQLLGDEKKPSMMQLLEENMSRLERIERAQVEHVEQWHGGGMNAPTPFQRGRRK